jgi:hypothetical protein
MLLNFSVIEETGYWFQKNNSKNIFKRYFQKIFSKDIYKKKILEKKILEKYWKYAHFRPNCSTSIVGHITERRLKTNWKNPNNGPLRKINYLTNWSRAVVLIRT